MKLGHVTTRILLTLGLLLFAACHRMAPIENYPDQPIPQAATQLPLTEIAARIKAAGMPYDWIFTDVAPGKMTATYSNKRSATIEIDYSQTSYSIKLVSSELLYQNGDEISVRYNSWVRRLNTAIMRRLASGA
jgi:hypothetical protein